MTPVEFVLPDGGQYNDPVGAVVEALQKPLVIRSSNHEWEVLSYYYSEGVMNLDIQKKGKHGDSQG